MSLFNVFLHKSEDQGWFLRSWDSPEDVPHISGSAIRLGEGERPLQIPKSHTIFELGERRSETLSPDTVVHYLPQALSNSTKRKVNAEQGEVLA